MELFTKLLFLLIAPIFLLVAPKLLRSYKFRMTAIFLHTIFLLLLTITVFNRPSWGWETQKELVNTIQSDKKEAYKFIQDNFILIDNSFDKILIPYEEGSDGDSTVRPITNRRMLGELFTILNEQIKEIDFVVLDMGFDAFTEDDVYLNNEFVKLNAQGKLLTAEATGLYDYNVFSFDKDFAGNVKQYAPEGYMTIHSIFQNKKSSLPYLVYAKMEGIKYGAPFLFNTFFWEKSSVRNGLVSNHFFPSFKLTNESRMIENGEQISEGVASEREFKFMHSYFLSELSTADQKRAFADNMKTRKQLALKNIVFIGSFRSDLEDLHHTSFGPLHGPVIILNTVYALFEGQHFMSWFLLLLLLIGYFLINFIMVYRCLGIPFFKHFIKINYLTVVSEKPKYSDGYWKNVSNKISLRLIDTLKMIVDFLFVEELHLVLLIIFVVLINIFTGNTINALALVLYFGIISTSLRYFRNKANHI